MGLNRILPVVLLIGWMIGGTWWHVCHIKLLCGDDAPAITAVAPALAVDSSAVVIVDTPAVAVPTAEQTLAEKQAYTSVLKPLDLYFAPGKSDFIHTPATEKFFAEAANYLPEHTDKKLRLTGHTDNTGKAAANMSLSRQRAEVVRQMMEKAGIKASQLQATGKGQTAPKATNATPEGRRENRRVTVVVE